MRCLVCMTEGILPGSERCPNPRCQDDLRRQMAGTLPPGTMLRNGTIRIEINDPDIQAVLTKTGAVIKGVDKHDITLRHLLTHTSGLPAWRPLYLLAENKADALA